MPPLAIASELKSKSQRSSDNVKIARHAQAIVLAQVIEVFREVLIEYLAPTDREPVAHPAVNGPVVENLVGDKKRQIPFRVADRMLDLKTIAISRRVHPRISKPALKLVSIAQPELFHVEAQSHRKRQTILQNLPVANRLHADVQVVWRHSHILSGSESKTNAEAFIDRTVDVAPDTQRPQNSEIKLFGHRHRHLHISPLLIICSIELRLRTRRQYKHGEKL